jgi:hypothetical protein
MIDLSKISEAEKTPLVMGLLQIIEQQSKIIELLREEIARLKGHKGKPRIPPSSLEKEPGGKPDNFEGKRPGSAKRFKTKELVIHETIPISPEALPSGSKYEGYDDYIVQGLKIETHNICYRLECWRSPDGALIKGTLPVYVDGHFSAELRSYMLYQYHQCHVTQPLLLESLLEIGVDISAGQVSAILTEKNDVFHQEKKGLLIAGLDVSTYISVDDTGARHAGKNGYCTVIGNDLFTWFESTCSKSRINFLKLLRNDHQDYEINDDAIGYMALQSLPQSLLEELASTTKKHFESDEEWKKHLESLGISNERHIRIVTEGALFGSILHHGFSRELVILSDDAGQFNVFLHALCWIHAERTIHKLIPCSEKEKEEIESIRTKIWDLYRDFKVYIGAPEQATKYGLEERFDELFAIDTCSEQLNKALQRLANNKKELLLFLDRPDVPLHTNGSERDIREYVKKRKISGSTRSDAGKRCRDTFTSLKKTCRKLGISFWDYLHDRIGKINKIPPLPDIIRARCQTS